MWCSNRRAYGYQLFNGFMSLIRNSNQVKQAIDFSGLQNGKIHPSDIDAVLEFNNEVLILIEVKRINNKIPTGQRLLLERICDSWHTKKSIVLKVTHDFKIDEADIPLKLCNVEQVYFGGKWIRKESKLLDALQNIGRNWNISKLNF